MNASPDQMCSLYATLRIKASTKCMKLFAKPCLTERAAAKERSRRVVQLRQKQKHAVCVPSDSRERIISDHFIIRWTSSVRERWRNIWHQSAVPHIHQTEPRMKTQWAVKTRQSLSVSPASALVFHHIFLLPKWNLMNTPPHWWSLCKYQIISVHWGTNHIIISLQWVCNYIWWVKALFIHRMKDLLRNVRKLLYIISLLVHV